MIYENNRKVTKFVLCVPDDNTRSLSYSISQNGEKQDNSIFALKYTSCWSVIPLQRACSLKQSVSSISE